ncbi:hypothetical protein GH810_03490 [Acetobacterium paludosum]|uniref:Uncharacterized protein n=1 Tax=Acetobacterium paludosum TaxID=52693 RepID=A0A923HS62_9FIRM|nr:hypothetical protein [Acetobacterium paludosum]MBC3887371.1 hypothetical protein [Acetobacterium paludosum]
MLVKENDLETIEHSSVESSENSAKGELSLVKNYLTRSFIKEYTSFDDLESFLNSGGFSAATQLEFQSILEADLDTLVMKNSKFTSWSEMVSSSGDYFFVTQMKEIKFK